jgi:hypothetical protein
MRHIFWSGRSASCGAYANPAKVSSPKTMSLYGDAELFAHSLSDSDIAVRIAAVRALVSVDASAEVARAAAVDPSREVRVTIAKALATMGTGSDLARSALAALVDDPDALVRGAAYEALGTTGCPAALAARAVRKAAVLALTRHRAVGDGRAALATATTDSDADVRAYAARAL